jgi:PIN domain nuclease of toxin-antitoxin system
VKILLDTSAFLWAITEDPRLKKSQRAAFASEANELFLSVASVWKILIKAGLGKLAIPLPAAAYIHRQMEQNRIVSLGIQGRHLVELERLPPLHRDPFDRMIVAQARAEGWPVMTGDREIGRYGVKVV